MISPLIGRKHAAAIQADHIRAAYSHDGSRRKQITLATNRHASRAQLFEA
jgi:hypothetical protein